jgi:predicted nucleotidyltransferase
MQRLVRAFAPEKILLFGSYAKGTADGGSDIDLLIVADDTGNVFLNHRLARQLAADCFPRVDIIFATPEEVAGAATARSPFLHSILGKSVTLYSRPTKLLQSK